MLDRLCPWRYVKFISTEVRRAAQYFQCLTWTNAFPGEGSAPVIPGPQNGGSALLCIDAENRTDSRGSHQFSHSCSRLALMYSCVTLEKSCVRAGCEMPLPSPRSYWGVVAMLAACPRSSPRLRRSRACSWPRTLLILTCSDLLTSRLDLGLISSRWACLMVWTLGWPCLVSPIRVPPFSAFSIPQYCAPCPRGRCPCPPRCRPQPLAHFSVKSSPLLRLPGGTEVWLCLFLMMLHLLLTPRLARRKLSGLLQLWFVLFSNCFQEEEDTVNMRSDLMSSYAGIKIWLCILDKAHPIPD